MRTIQSPTLHPTLHERTSQLSLRKTLWDSFLAIDRLLALWRERRQQRDQLRQMPEYLLLDIGLTEADALEEASKPFWRD